MVVMEKKAFFKRLSGHFITITRHKLLVTFSCIKCGLYKQGLLHDLSKYSPTEFFAGVKYYQGYRSPIDAEKEDKGYSLGWLHHKGRNRHHWEYWLDKKPGKKEIYCLDMPLNYVIEACIDKISASKIYNGDNYKDDAAYEFLIKGADRYCMHEHTFQRFEYLLGYLKDHGETKAFRYYKELYHQWKKDKNFDI